MQHRHNLIAVHWSEGKGIKRGIRLPKRPKLAYSSSYKPIPVRPFFPIVGSDSYTPPRPVSVRVSSVPRRNVAGNLQNSDYRFWIGSPNDYSRMAFCRACGARTWSATDRKKHRDEAGCNDLLVKAYNRFNKWKRCVVCDRECSNRRWGVMLHTGCIPDFMFDYTTQYSSLVAAIELTRLNEVTKASKD